MFIPRAEMGPDGKLNPSKKIIILSGAGLDAPSGIQTFRGEKGLWNGHSIDEICSEKTWKDNYLKVHKFYNERRTELKTKEPNEVHLAIKEIISKCGKENVFNITQNVTDFFERIDTEVLHLHGELTKMECSECYHKWDIGYEEFNPEDSCPKCNKEKAVRPAVVFYGGPAQMYSYLFRAFEYNLNPDTVVLIIGTSGEVLPINDLVQRKHGLVTNTILCNLEKQNHINEEFFSDIYYEDISSAITKIQNKINNIKRS